MSKLGQKYLKPMLKRIAREHPELLEQACRKILEDAAGKTLVKHAVHHEGQAIEYELEIEPVDRHRALALFGDRVDGKPLQEVAVEPGTLANVITLYKKLGDDPGWPETVQEILRQKDEDSGLPDDPDDDSDG